MTFLMAIVAIAPSCGGGGYSNEDPDNPYEWGKGDGKDEPGEEGKTFYPKAEGSFRIMTYNVGAFCKYISAMNQNIDLVAKIIKEVDADVVGLNELDSMNTRHNVNQVAILAQTLGNWQWHFGKGIDYRGGSYGNGVSCLKEWPSWTSTRCHSPTRRIMSPEALLLWRRTST